MPRAVTRASDPTDPDVSSQASAPEKLERPPLPPDDEAPLLLDRASIAAGALQDMIARSGLADTLLSDEDHADSIASLLAEHPAGKDVWVFGYGSLIWNPAFRFVERHLAVVHGWHRQFCIGTPLGRGSPDCPGLVLGLDRSGACKGVAYRIAAEAVADELPVIWRREMVTGSYIPRWADAHLADTDGLIHDTVKTIIFTVNRDAANYEGRLEDAEVADRIARARGQLGPNRDYLDQTVASLHAEGIDDSYLHRIWHHIAESERTG